MNSVLLFFAFVFFAAVPAMSARAANSYDAKIQATDLYKQLDAAWKKGGILGVNALVSGGKFAVQGGVEILSLWTRDNYVNVPNPNPRIGLMYAETLRILSDGYKAAGHAEGAAGLFETSALSYYTSRLIAAEDVSRCADNTAGQAYLQNWKGDAAGKYRDYLMTLSAEQKSSLWSKIQNFSNKRDVSMADKSACGSGSKAMARAVKNGDCAAPQKDKVVACNAAKYVELIPDEQWLPIRNKTQEAFKAYLLKDSK